VELERLRNGSGPEEISEIVGPNYVSDLGIYKSM